MTAEAVAARFLSPEVGDGDAPAAPRVLVVEDHELVAQSLVFLLRAEGLAATVATGPDGVEILELAAAFQPHVVLLDLDLGAMGSGVDLIEPLVEMGSAVVVLTGVTDRMTLGRCIERGAVGVVNKAEPADRVFAAIGAAVTGGAAMDADERHALLSELRSGRERERKLFGVFETLTPREQDVLIALADGLGAAEIASEDFVSVFTVRGHIRSILAKLGVKSQLAAVARARQAGWLPPPRGNGQS